VALPAMVLAGTRSALRRKRRHLGRSVRMQASSAGEYDYDLFTIGGGSGGVRASRFASKLFGAKVALAELPFAIISSKYEEGGLGGTCVIRGCVPKKLLIYGSHVHEDIADAKGYGWEVESEPKLHWDKLIAAKNAEVTRLNGIYKGILSGSDVEHFEGYARVVDPHTVEVDGKKFTTKYICVATGSRATKLNIPGADLPGVLTSDEALDLPEQPKKMLIIGGGFIAVEFAGYFHGYGTEVHLAYRADKPLRGFDTDVQEHVADCLKQKGINVQAGESPAKIETTDGGLLVTMQSGMTLVVDKVMFATGRAPNSADLGLEAAGVELDPKNGQVLVDEYSKTNVDSIYAIGDVTNRINLTPVALMEGGAMAKTLFGGEKTRPDHENVPSAVFSQPPVSCCGLTEKEAAIKYGSVDVYLTKFKPMKHTMPTGRGEEERIMMKLICISEGQPDAGKVVGLHAVGADTPEMMQGLGVAMKAGATKTHFDTTIGIHPTAAEEWCTMREKTRTTTKSDAEKMH